MQGGNFREEGRNPMGMEEMVSSLDRIKRQLNSASACQLLQGSLLKRSETLRVWNDRWVILDPTSGKMEYKGQRNHMQIKGTIAFDSTSTIALSPVNFHGLPKYDGCCFHIDTPGKKELFFCAETPGAARAWISTLHASQLVLRAHKEAVNALDGNGSAGVGNVAAAVAAANATAVEASKEIEAAMRTSSRSSLVLRTNSTTDGQSDYLTVMKETLREKDEELHQLCQDIRARDSTIRDISEKLAETAAAAEAAASAAHSMDEQRRLFYANLKHLKGVFSEQVEASLVKLKESEEKVLLLITKNELLRSQRDDALQEAQSLRSEIGKARGNAVILEAAVVRAEEKERISCVDAKMRSEEAAEQIWAAEGEKQGLVALVSTLRSQTNRLGIEEREASLSMPEAAVMKHADFPEDNVDKACLSDVQLVPREDDDHLKHSVADFGWDNHLHQHHLPVIEASSLDIPVFIRQPTDDGRHVGS